MSASPMIDSAWSAASATDRNVYRAAAEAEQHADARVRAARVVAGAARDLEDARTLLDVLGLHADDLRAAAQGR